MKNRIDAKFSELKRKRQKAFIAFITAGDPSLAVTEKLVLSFADAGVDIVELGVPFSDPLADGPTIQAASYRALKRQVTLAKIFETVARIRKRSQIPIALMTYYNPVFRFGEERFLFTAKKTGVDGVIIPDLPPEEARGLMRAAKRQGIAIVFFLSPTTAEKRIKRIAKSSTGFIYYVSITGVTGARQELPKTLWANVRHAKRMTKKPICVGFGISTPTQVRSIAKIADGVIVGSAIVKQIEKYTGKTNLVAAVSRFVKQLAQAVKSS